MTELYKAESRLEAWLNATDSILNEGIQQDVILHIESPHIEHEDTPEVFERLKQHYDEAGEKPIHTVSEWIFPGWLYRRVGLDGVFEQYPDQLEEIMTSSSRWGTYFGRMIDRKGSETGKSFNPLKKVIEKLEKANDPDNQTYHSCYEIEIQDLALYNSSSDRNEWRGLPCLTHLSFKLFEGDIHLTAFYRSHDYRFKVPGNLRGLARLQNCIANEIGAGTGQLVVHSSRVFVKDGQPMDEFRNIISESLKQMNNSNLFEYY